MSEPIVIEAPSDELKASTDTETSLLVSNAKALVIKTKEDLETVGADALLQVSTQRKKLEAERVKMKAPSLEAGKLVDDFFKPFLSQLVEAEGIIKKTIVSAKQGFDKIDAEKEAKILKRSEIEGRGRITEETAINQVSALDRVEKTVRSTSGSMTFKKVKQVEITNLQLIPVEYLRPKTIEEFKDFKPWPAIQRAALQLYDLIESGHAGINQIPGVEVKLVDSLSAR